jgi:hypothetical protein
MFPWASDGKVLQTRDYRVSKRVLDRRRNTGSGDPASEPETAFK